MRGFPIYFSLDECSARRLTLRVRQTDLASLRGRAHVLRRRLRCHAPTHDCFVAARISVLRTTVADAIYFSESLQTQWKVTLFPVEVRRVLFLLAELLCIVEVFFWPVALFLLIRERRASLPPTI